MRLSSKFGTFQVELSQAAEDKMGPNLKILSWEEALVSDQMKRLSRQELSLMLLASKQRRIQKLNQAGSIRIFM